MDPHPRNTGFHWQNTPATPRFLSQSQVDQYNDQGFFLLENAFTPEEVSEVTAEIDVLEAKFAALLGREHNGEMGIAAVDRITFSVHLVKRSPSCKAFSQHPVIKGVVHDLIGDRVRLYWDQAVYKKPGTPEEFPWHQDNGYTYIEPQQYLTCWVALTDATESNGCPWVVPGLHRLGTLRHRRERLGLQCLDDPEGAVAVPARAGDVVVFSSLTPHRTGPNLTTAVRKSYILQYAPDGAMAWSEGSETAAPQNDRERQYLID